MVSSHQVDCEKAAKYAIAASKGFSYYLPKSAQRHLQELLKQLPSAARSVYNEYYRDLMCAKACAPESAVAMKNFVTSSFPKIAKKHNAFAHEMNEEIDVNEHEGYEPVKFPIVAEPVLDKEEASFADTGRKRKFALAGPLSSPSEGATLQKKVKTKSDTVATAASNLVTAPPPSSSSMNSGSPARTNTDSAGTELSTEDPTATGGIQRLAPESVRSADDNQDSRASSPLSDVPSSSQLSDEYDAHEELEEQPGKDIQDLSRGTTPAVPVENYDSEELLSPHPDALLRSVDDDDDFPATPGTCGAEPEIRTDNQTQMSLSDVPISPAVISPSTGTAGILTAESSTLPKNVEGFSKDHTSDDPLAELDYTFAPEKEHWQDGLRAIEDFDWDRKGSQWAGRPRSSEHPI